MFYLEEAGRGCLPLAAGGLLGEDGLDALHVELRRTIVEVHAILLLLYVGELCEGVAPDVVRDGHQCINLTFETGVELLQ